jgi:proteic killer suppression protein
MICSFKDKDTAAVFARAFVKRFSGIEQSAYMRLARLTAAQTLADLSAIPGNRLETLKGNRKGQHSIRVNDQWRICFRWVEGKGPHDVEIVDYH